MTLGSSLILQVLFVLLLIAFNAFFAASEIAIISLNDTKIRKMAEEGDKKAILLQNLISEPSRFLATIQVGITLAGLLASAFATESFADELAGLMIKIGITFSPSVVKVASVIIITLLLSYLTLVLGELVPKRFAMQKSEGISMRVIGPLTLLSRLTSPFVRFLTISTNFFVRLLGGNPSFSEEKITEEEIRMMMDMGEEKGVIQESEKEMIDNIFEFDTTIVSEIMTHRTDIVGIADDASLNDIMNIAVNEKFTRIPVYEETIDNIIGILHVKDLIQYLNKGARDNFKLKSIIRKPYFIPSSKKIDELFKELQQNKTHMAVVIDEYGGTAGIVTIEDLLEEIVGNIFDEYDEDEKEYEKIDDNTYMINGAASLDTVNEILESMLPTEDYETLGGFVMGQLGRIPDESEKPEFEFNSIIFKVEEVDEKRITKVKICRA